jgi:Probable N6-adenine methyltransferase
MNSEPNESSIASPDHPRTSTTRTTKDATMEKKTRRIGFIACPTAYVAFQHLYPELLSDRKTDEDNKPMDPHSSANRASDEIHLESYLFDYDERFSLLTPPVHTPKRQQVGSIRPLRS